ACIASVVDQNVEGPAPGPLDELVVESLEQGRDGRRVDEVRVDRERSASSFLDGCHRLVCARFAGVVGQRDRGAILRKTFGYGAANAARRPGNESRFSFKRLVHLIFFRDCAHTNDRSDRPGVARQSCARPPSTATSLAVMKLLSDDARKAAAA